MSSRRRINVLTVSLVMAVLFVLDAPGQTRRSKSDQTKPGSALKNEATNVAENYWNKRFTRCGQIVVWALLRPSGGVRTKNLELVLFASKDVPVVVVEETPGAGNEKPSEWLGRSRITIQSAQDIHPAKSPTQTTWHKNLTYAVTIRRTEGVWEAIEDESGERTLAQPLFEDIRSEHPMILESCLRFGGDPNMRNDSGDTLLMAAASRGSEYAVAELLNKDADANLKHRNGWTASYLARLNNHEGVAQLIDQAGGVCEGPVKSVCDKYPKPPTVTGTIEADPLLIPPDPRANKRDQNAAKPDNSTKVIFFGIPQPEYTEEARRHRVTGTVILRVTFLPTGEVGNIRTVSGLPFGLTEKAIEAARKIKFIPATIDGRKIEKVQQVEFNFKLP